MRSARQTQPISIADYLDGELTSSRKLEFVDGVVYACGQGGTGLPVGFQKLPACTCMIEQLYRRAGVRWLPASHCFEKSFLFLQVQAGNK